MKKLNDLLKIGVSGLMGSGKSEALEYFKKKLIPTYDLDIESKKLLKINSRVYFKVIKKFGVGILNKNKTINKRKLRELVFNNSSARIQLNNIVHPEVLKMVVMISKKESKKKKTLIVFEGALISKKTDIGKFLNKIIFVHTPEKILAKRISTRDGLSIKDALKLLKMQNNIKKNRKSADIVVLNDKSIKNLHKQLNLVLDKLAY